MWKIFCICGRANNASLKWHYKVRNWPTSMRNTCAIKWCRFVSMKIWSPRTSYKSLADDWSYSKGNASISIIKAAAAFTQTHTCWKWLAMQRTIPKQFKFQVKSWILPHTIASSFARPTVIIGFGVGPVRPVTIVKWPKVLDRWSANTAYKSVAMNRMTSGNIFRIQCVLNWKTPITIKIWSMQSNEISISIVQRPNCMCAPLKRRERLKWISSFRSHNKIYHRKIFTCWMLIFSSMFGSDRLGSYCYDFFSKISSHLNFFYYA